MYIKRASLKPIYLEKVIGNSDALIAATEEKSREEMKDDCHHRRRRHNNNAAFIHLNSASHLIIQLVLHHVFPRHVYQMSVIVLSLILPMHLQSSYILPSFESRNHHPANQVQEPFAFCEFISLESV